jgi:hypothetical protein
LHRIAASRWGRIVDRRAARRLTASGLPAASSTKQPNTVGGCHPSYAPVISLTVILECHEEGMAPLPPFQLIPFIQADQISDDLTHGALRCTAEGAGHRSPQAVIYGPKREQSSTTERPKHTESGLEFTIIGLSHVALRG